MKLFSNENTKLMHFHLKHSCHGNGLLTTERDAHHPVVLVVDPTRGTAVQPPPPVLPLTLSTLNESVSPSVGNLSRKHSKFVFGLWKHGGDRRWTPPLTHTPENTPAVLGGPDPGRLPSPGLKDTWSGNTDRCWTSGVESGKGLDWPRDKAYRDEASKDEGFRDKRSRDRRSRDRGSRDKESRDWKSRDWGSRDRGSRDWGPKRRGQVPRPSSIQGEDCPMTA